MKDTTPAQTSATNNNGRSSSGGGSKKKKKRKFNNSKKKIPKVGDPDYLSPTQLRNRRKRRAKKQQKKEVRPQSKEVQQQESSLNPNRSSNNKSGNSNNEALQDPSMKYINYPTKAPIIRTAKKYLEPLLENNTFNVYIGPLYRWRTVSKLAVRPDHHNGGNKVAIGLFAENSHSLLPVPKCKAHHSSINRIVELVTKACHDVGVIPYGTSSNDDTEQQETAEKHHQQGQLRYIGVNIERSSGSAQLTLVWNGKREEEKEDEQLEKLLDAILTKSSGCRKEDSGEEELPMKKRRRRGKRDDNNNNKDSYQGKGDVKKMNDSNHNTVNR